LSSTYKVVSGDTVALIARKVYGTENEAGRIARANPGLAEPLTPGTTLNVPAIPGAPVDLQGAAPAASADEVAVLIDGQRFRFWDQIRLQVATDQIATVEFSAPFDPDTPGMRETFRPFSYKPLTVSVGGEQLFSGTLVGVSPTVDVPRVLSVSGYSLPGVLNDCSPPASAYPIEFNGQTLPNIAAQLCEPFGIAVDFRADGGAPFERVALEPGRTVLDFLADLAKQRNVVIANDAAGALVFWQSAATGSPVAQLAQGAAPVLSISSFFNPQDYYSHITGLEQVAVGAYGSQFTVPNPQLSGVVRPMSFRATDVEAGDVRTAVEAKAGRMFGNMVSYSAEVATWRDPQGALWQPNTTLTLHAPGAMIYDPFEFLIRSVSFSATSTTRVATLDLVIPGAFSGVLPEVLPWGA
jgi:prophage tail gpP-like protein/phage tail protein X